MLALIDLSNGYEFCRLVTPIKNVAGCEYLMELASKLAKYKIICLPSPAWTLA